MNHEAPPGAGTFLRALLPVLCLCGCAADDRARVEQVGAMREVMHDAQTEPRITIAEVVARPHAFAVGALAGLSGEITIADSAVWVARVAGSDVTATGPAPVAGDAATLLTISHVAAWVPVPIEAAAEGAPLEALIERLAAAHGQDVARPFPFVIEGVATDVDLHVINGFCLTSMGATATEAPPWRWSLDRATRVQLVGFYARGAAGVMTHHGTSMHVHAILEKDGRTITGHVDRFVVAPGMTLRLPAR